MENQSKIEDADKEILCSRAYIALSLLRGCAAYWSQLYFNKTEAVRQIPFLMDSDIISRKIVTCFGSFVHLSWIHKIVIGM